ncbi:MAG: two-component regulator propeller domain-containing protein, partial [Maribacter sp.]
MKYKLFYLLVFTLCLSNLCNSQTQQLKFNKIEGSNEITLGKINALAKDGHGFMWFSDQDNRCIIRYDGSQMIRYQHDPKNPNSLGGYYPESLFIDASGIIWIGFYGEGIDRFDPATNTFTHYDHDPNDPSSLSSDMVSNIFVDHLNNIWIGTDDGLDLLNQKSGTFTHYKYDINDTTSLSCNSVRAIYEDRQGTLWVGTGFAFDNVDEGGLNRFERDTGTFTRFLHDPDDPHSLIADKVRAIFEDSKGNFWIGTNGDGLHSMDRKTGQFTRYTNDPAKPDQLSSPPVNSTYSHITFITEDADENLWIGSESGGINRYDPLTKKTTHFGNDADNSGQFIDNSGWCILASPDGLVWLSTQETNLYKIDLYNINIPQIIENTFVSCFFQESASVLWIGTGKGLLRQNLKDGTTREFAHDPLNPNSLSDNNITKIIKDKQGIMWLGTESGLNRYDPTTDIITRYHHDPNDSSSLSNDYINDIVEDNDLNLWIGTLGGGLDRLDRDTGIFTHNSHNPADSNSLNWNFVRTIFNDETNNLWIGLDGNAGLDKLNKETGRITNYL